MPGAIPPESAHRRSGCALDVVVDLRESTPGGGDQLYEGSPGGIDYVDTHHRLSIS